MTISSMTGFGKGEASGEEYSVNVEIKSVNHRFKDIRFKMSSIFNAVEVELRKKLSHKFCRGSFDVFINFKRAENNNKFDDIDLNKVQGLINTLKPTFDEQGVQMTINPTDFCRSEFLTDKDLSKDPLLLELLITAFDQAVISLGESRSQEGEKLKAVLVDHKGQYLKHFKIIEEKADEFQKHVKERLTKKFKEMISEIKIDEPRYMQEVVYYLEKMDVQEEINRIKVHLAKLDQLLLKGGETGRQMDFLVQELNRETNTIGSKSNMEEVSESVIQMKVHLEKIREQGLNIE